MQAEKFNKLKVANILREASPKKPKPPTNDPHKTIYIITIIALIITMLPFISATILGTVFFIVSIPWLIFNCHKHKYGMSRTFVSMTTALTIASFASGCSPTIAGPMIGPQEMCGEEVCLIGTATGLSVCGYPVIPVTIQMAQENSEITDRVGTEVITGHGLISVTKIYVYGS